MLVTTGLPSNFKNNGHTTSVFTAIDGLRPRSAATALELLQFKNSKLVSSIARSVAMLCLGSRQEAVSGANTVEIIRAVGGSIEKIASVSAGPQIVRMRTGSLGCIAFWHTTSPDQAESFLQEAQTVTGGKKAPSRALARWSQNSKCGGGQAAISLIHVCSSAIQHTTEGNQVEKLYGSEDSVKWLIGTNRQLSSKILALFKL
jgi:hypothetical protein